MIGAICKYTSWLLGLKIAASFPTRISVLQNRVWRRIRASVEAKAVHVYMHCS